MGVAKRGCKDDSPAEHVTGDGGKDEREGSVGKEDEIQGGFSKGSTSSQRRPTELRRLGGRGAAAIRRQIELVASGEHEHEAKPAACLSHGHVSVIGRRREMEDAVTVAPPGFAAALGCDFFGVYDGHGGARVAHACRERMHVALAAAAAAEGEGRWREAMAAAFATVDEEATAAGNGGGAAAEGADKTVGSTAVVAVVGRARIVVANCGDSRAVLCRAGVAFPLSDDHKPDRPDEMERVEAAGGKVINWDGFRVLGVLATSRSIGDYYLKPYVIAEPEVTVTDRTEKDEFLVLASDGLWDVMSNEAVCRVVRQCLSGRAAKLFPEAVRGRSAAEAAAVLTELAISRGSKDNISVVVVELKRLGSKG